MKFSLRLFLLLYLLIAPTLTSAQSHNRVTILYDAFGKQEKLTRDWGFSALLEYGDKRILFDTGNSANLLEHNVKALGVDLTRLDAVVITHRHADHAAGLTYVLSVNPSVKVYVPDERFSLFGSKIPGNIYRPDPTLSDEMRYFNGHPPAEFVAGSAWSNAHFLPVKDTTEILPGIFLFSTVSQVPGTLELRELSMAVRTPRGLALFVGCSHPGIEEVLKAASAINPRVFMLSGGLHLISAPDPEVVRVATALHDQWKLDSVAPGHCTGEPEFAALKKTFGDHYVYAGLGTIIDLP
jgi:7,8-dihydropterin-6-yl-methyl-4-(beta-D-ribofuranosyl)aminobenzene 5'-phosphate synthase